MDQLRDLLGQDQEKEMAVGTNRKAPEMTEVEVYSYSIEEALKTAAESMQTSIVNLEYEVLERGASGFLGFGKKPYKVLIKLSGNFTGQSQAIPDSPDIIDFEAPSFEMNQNGRFKVTVTRDGIFLKVEGPRGKGRPVAIDEVITNIKLREMTKFNENAVKQAVESSNGKSIKIGDYMPSQYDGRFNIQVSPDEMKAFATFTKPEKYGRVVDVQEIVSGLKGKNIYYGIKEQAIRDAVENEIFNLPVIIAEGDLPVEGRDAQIKYHFKVEQGAANFAIEDDGSVDYHKLDIVQSVVIGQVLATKMPAERGKPGKTLSGRVIPSRDGRDLKLINGNNTHVSPDGSQIIADINGQVLFKNNKVQVEPVFEVSGDVDLSTGDINFPGNVIIYGNVNDTFKVYSGANIEIKGNIGKAQVVAEGNIIVRQGIQGKDEAKITCAGDLYAKFIERANIKSEGYVVVTEVILHSDVESKKKVICQGGKRSQIAGGRIRTLFGINAKFLGAESYTETLLQAGVDPEAEDKIASLVVRKTEITKELPPIAQELSNLTQLTTTGALPPEKQQRFNNLTMKNNELKQELSQIDEQVVKIQQYMEGLGKDAKISASKIVYPGVKVRIKSEVLVVKNDYKFVTFYKDGANIKIAPYEKSKEMDEMKDSGKARRTK